MIAIWFFARGADAAEAARHPMRLSITFGEPVQVPNVTLFEAPEPRLAAISPDEGTVAVACEPKTGTHVALFRIGADGTVQDEPVSVPLPLPLALKDFEQRVLAFAFHTEKPLLYVWRDVIGPRKDHPPVDVLYNELDHLLVYTIEGGSPTLAKQACRGRDYAFGIQMGGLGLDPVNRRLYVPNTQKPRRKEEVNVFCTRMGYIDLDEAGFPAFVANDAGASAAKLTIRSYPMRWEGCYGLDPASGYHMFPLGQHGLIPVGDKAVLYVDKHDVYTIVMDSDYSAERGRAPSSWYPLLEIGGAHWCRCTIHPRLPVIYVSAHNRTFAIQHVDGYPTLLPQIVSTDQAIMSAPVVMSRSGKLAGGGQNAVFLLQLDANGFITGAAEKVSAGPDYVRALVYSEKHDKLYVPVSKLPEAPK